MNRQLLFDYVMEEYGTTPEYLWESSPEHAVLRHAKGSKWYGIVMRVRRKVLGFDSDDFVDVLNVKCLPGDGDFFRRINGILPAYHMNKEHWISILLDGTVDDSLIKDLLEKSYRLTAAGRKKEPEG